MASDPQRAQRWTGLRQDSGDPKVFSLAAKQLWIKMGIDPMSSTSIHPLFSHFQKDLIQSLNLCFGVDLRVDRLLRRIRYRALFGFTKVL